MEDTVVEMVTFPPNAAVDPTPSTSRKGDSSLMMAWISGFGMIINSSGIGMLLSSLKEDEAFTYNLSRVATHPLKK